MTLATTLTLQIQAYLSKSLDLSLSPNAPLDHKFEDTLADGTGADQADLLFTDTRTISASSNDDLDLAGGLTDPLGDTLTFVRIKAMFISAAAGNTNNVLVGGAGANDFINWVGNSSDIIVVMPGGGFFLFAPDATAYAVTAGTGDILRVANSAGGSTVDYDIVLIGSSA
tara:strand:- start:1236 stop:1745 length:510 start_codon:yes stop_codon:yes gene_type:complete